MTSDEVRTYSTEEAAELLGVTGQWLRKRAQKGQVPYVQLGRRRRFTAAQIKAIADTFTKHPAQPPTPQLPARRRKVAAG